jgi:hypothetical protein
MLQTSVSTPLWLELIKLVIGPLIGASVVILGLIWRDRIERRNAAQTWYEQTYITEGLDVIMGHLAALAHSLSEGRRLMIDIQVTPLPSAVSRRLLSLELLDFLMGVDLVEAITLATTRRDHPIQLTEDESTELMAFCVGLMGYTEEIRRFFLDKRITAKSDIYKIVKDPRFKALTKDLHDNFLVKGLDDDFLKGINLTIMTASLKTRYRPRIAEAARALKSAKPPTA